MAITNTANFDYMFRSEKINVNATSIIEQGVLPVVTMTKKATPDVVYSGDTVTYFVTIIIGDFQGQITEQVFSDAIPSELEFVDGTLTVDTVSTAGSPKHIDVNWMPNSEHLIVYQCLVL